MWDRYCKGDRVDAVSFLHTPPGADGAFLDALAYGTPLDQTLCAQILHKSGHNNSVFLADAKSIQERLLFRDWTRLDQTVLSPDRTLQEKLYNAYERVSVKIPSFFQTWTMPGYSFARIPYLPLKRTLKPIEVRQNELFYVDASIDFSSIRSDMLGLVFPTESELFHSLIQDAFLQGLLNDAWEIFCCGFWVQKTRMRYKNHSTSELLLALSEGHFERWYSLSKDIARKHAALRLGKERSHALSRLIAIENWQDPHKAHIEEKKTRAQIESVGFLVPQIMDNNHAPTRILVNQVQHITRYIKKCVVVSTEYLQLHPFEYPFTPVCAQSSVEQGSDSIKALQAAGAKIYISESTLRFEEKSAKLASMLQNVDLLFVFESDILNTLTVEKCPRPKKVYMELSRPIDGRGYDAYVVGDAIRLEALKKAGYSGITLQATFFPDVRVLPQKKYTKKALVGADNARILVTASNHFAHRLSQEACTCIAKLLERFEDTHYLCVGRMPDDFFATHFASSLRPRLHYIGFRQDLQYILASCDLYLNEFPEGGGMAIFNGMAVSLPVVSIYDEDPQKPCTFRSSICYMDKSLCSKTPQEYFARACELLSSPQAYTKAQNDMLAAYKNLINTSRDFERLFQGICPQTSSHFAPSTK